MTSVKKATRRNHIYLPQLDDLLRFLNDWCSRTGVTRAELANLLGHDRSAVTNIFNKSRGLYYHEAEDITDYLLQRISPLPNEPIRKIAIAPRDLVYARSSDSVADAARRMIKGNFTQIPVFDDDGYLGLVTDRMIVERLLHPNVKEFKGTWVDASGRCL